MARRVFFSFHYQRDIWRVNQIRSIPNVTGCSAAGFQDASIWEDAKKKGDDAIKKLIRDGLKKHIRHGRLRGGKDRWPEIHQLRNRPVDSTREWHRRRSTTPSQEPERGHGHCQTN